MKGSIFAVSLHADLPISVSILESRAAVMLLIISFLVLMNGAGSNVGKRTFSFPVIHQAMISTYTLFVLHRHRALSGVGAPDPLFYQRC